MSRLSCASNPCFSLFNSKKADFELASSSIANSFRGLRNWNLKG
jgi:hypothetical protein